MTLLKQLKATNFTLCRQLENHELLAIQEYGDLTKEVSALRKEVHIHRNRESKIHKNPMYLLPYMKQHMTSDYLPDLLRLTESFITTEYLQHFYRENHNLFYLLMRRVNLLAYRSRNKKRPYRMQKKKNASNTDRLGYVMYEEPDRKFVDVTESASFEIYPINAKKRNPSTKTSKREYTAFGNFKVLILGSRFMSEYKHRLEKHGCHVEIHNSYEESFEVLKGKMNRRKLS